MLSLILNDQIPSGKGQVKQRFTRAGKRIFVPTKRFEDWRATAWYEIEQQKQHLPTVMKMQLPLLGKLKLTVVYHEVGVHRVRDVSGLLDALFHLIVTAEVIEDDGQIRDVDWHETDGGPCVQMKLEVL